MALTAKLLVSTHRHTHTYTQNRLILCTAMPHSQAKGSCLILSKTESHCKLSLVKFKNRKKTKTKLNTSLRPYRQSCCFFSWMVAVTLYTLKNSWTVLVLVCFRIYVCVTQAQNRLQWHSWLQWKKKALTPHKFKCYTSFHLSR